MILIGHIASGTQELEIGKVAEQKLLRSVEFGRAAAISIPNSPKIELRGSTWVESMVDPRGSTMCPLWSHHGSTVDPR